MSKYSHWYNVALSYVGPKRPEERVTASCIMSVDLPRVTKGDIQGAKEYAGMPSDAVVQCVSYLGYMTDEEMDHE